MKRRINTIVAGGLVLLGGAGFLGGNSGCANVTYQHPVDKWIFDNVVPDALTPNDIKEKQREKSAGASPNTIYEYYGDDVYVPVNISNKSRKIDGEWYNLSEGNAWLTDNPNEKFVVKIKYKDGKAIIPPEGKMWIKNNDFQNFDFVEYKIKNGRVYGILE